MARDITPEHLRCAYSMACPSVHQLQENDMCSIGACPSVTPHAGDLVIVGKIAMGIAQQVHRADGRLISDTIAADETAVLVPAAVVSEIPEVVRLREENGQIRQGCRNLCDALDSVLHEDSDKSEERKVVDRVIASELLHIFRTFLAQSSSPQAEEKA